VITSNSVCLLTRTRMLLCVGLDRFSQTPMIPSHSVGLNDSNRIQLICHYLWASIEVLKHLHLPPGFTYGSSLGMLKSTLLHIWNIKYSSDIQVFKADVRIDIDKGMETEW